MTSLNDARATALSNMGYANMAEWAAGNGGTSEDTAAAMIEALNTIGGGSAKTVTDAWFEMLRAAGHTGSRNDMELAYWINADPGDPAPPPEPGSLNDLVDALIAEGWDAVLFPPDAIKVDDFDGWVTITGSEIADNSYLYRTDISDPLKADISQWNET